MGVDDFMCYVRLHVTQTNFSVCPDDTKKVEISEGGAIPKKNPVGAARECAARCAGSPGFAPLPGPYSLWQQPRFCGVRALVSASLG